MYDFGIIGGGIVGLATAYQLQKKYKNAKVVVIEKENHLAAHQTGHNSGVIHSGIYYKPGSLKAQNCLRGYDLLLDFVKEHQIPFELCGKVIVATSEKELKQLDILHQRGLDNGLVKNTLIDKQEIAKIEPHVNAIKGIHVPYTGIIDYTEVCEKLGEIVKSNSGEIKLGHKVTHIQKKGEAWNVETSQGNLEVGFIINCAGLYSDKVASFTEKKVDTKIIPFRGEYYMIKPDKKHLVKNLIYPVPDPNFPFLGVHFTRMIGGEVEAGPNAVFAFSREGYSKSRINFSELMESLLWPGFQKVMAKYWKTGMGEMYRSFSKAAFTKALQNLIPDIKEDDLIKAEAGVRAQACDRDGGLLDDFKIIKSEGIVHVLNAPSPAATSSLSIGLSICDYV